MKEKLLDFNSILIKYKLQILFLLVGLIFLGSAILLIKNDFFAPTKIEILDEKVEGISDAKKEIIAEVSGAIEKPGVYHLPVNSRIDDLLIEGGGLSGEADRVWIEKNLNRAAKLTDGQKVFIPSLNEQSQGESANKTIGGINVAQSYNIPDSNLLNINTASLVELDTLSGIGPVYAQKIIDNRPYSNIEELISRKVLPQSTFDKIKSSINIY